MTQGDYWNLGVGLPLINPQFTINPTIGLTLNGAVTSGAVITVDAITSPAAVNAAFKAGDFITMGPSTHANNPGATEIGIVKALTATTITFWQNLTYDYADGDPVYGVGSNWPAGWGASVGMITNPSIAQGHRDQYAFKFDAHADTVSVWSLVIGNTAAAMTSYLADPLPSTYYRIGCMYKGTISGSADPFFLRAQATDGAGGYGINISASSFTTQANWTEKAAVGQSASIVQPRTFSLRIQANTSATEPNPATNFYFDNCYMVHAKGTSTASVGRITLAEPANFQSTRLGSRIQQRPLQVGATEYRHKAQLDSGKENKRRISASFSNVDQTCYDDLQILLDYQRRGSPLVLFPNLDDLPTAMYGWLEEPDFMKDMWDLGSHAFTLDFTEM